MVFDRVNHHLVRKHFDRGSDEYRETLNVYKQNANSKQVSQKNPVFKRNR